MQKPEPQKHKLLPFLTIYTKSPNCQDQGTVCLVYNVEIFVVITHKSYAFGEKKKPQS